MRRCLFYCLSYYATLFDWSESFFQMKCIWAECQDNDTSYCLKRQIGQIINVSISENSKTVIIGGKIFNKDGELSYSSRYNEIDFWLYYTDCHFNEDFSKLQWRMHDERMKQFNGKWKNEVKYYTSDLDSPVFSSKEEFELEWKNKMKTNKWYE